VTRYFDQGRDLSKPLVEVPPDSPWYERFALRLYGAYLWAIIGFTVVVAVVTFIVWMLGS
jgi:hypothetical protein